VIKISSLWKGLPITPELRDMHNISPCDAEHLDSARHSVMFYLFNVFLEQQLPSKRTLTYKENC